MCGGRQNNDGMRAKGDVYSLCLGGSVTSDVFINAAQQNTTQHNTAQSQCTI